MLFAWGLRGIFLDIIFFNPFFQTFSDSAEHNSTGFVQRLMALRLCMLRMLSFFVKRVLLP